MTNRFRTITSSVQIILLMFLCSPLLTCQEIATLGWKEKINNIDTLLSNLYSKGQFNGGFMIGNSDKILFQQVYGFADMHSKKPLRLNNAFGIASVNKTLTATLIMKMIELEYFTLDSKLIEFFPDLPYKDVTIDHLLTHTSGIPFYYDSLIKPHWDTSMKLTNDALFELYKTYRPKQAFPAGDQFAYSNAGYMFLAGIAERASKKSYDALLKALIFEPAEMNNTQRLETIKEDRNLAKAHALSIKKGAYVPLSLHEDYTTFLDFYYRDRKGAGGLNSTFSDLWRFSKALQSEKIIEKATLNQMLSPTVMNNGKRNRYAKGWQLEPVKGKRYVGHRGGSEGENCFFRIALDENYTYFLVSNTKTPYLSAINTQIKNILQGQPLEHIKISGVERLALSYNNTSYDSLAKVATAMSNEKNKYYYTLSEFNTVSWSYWLKEDYDKALDFLKLATVAMPDNAGVWDVLAEAYMELGSYEEAIKNYNITIDMLNADTSKKDKQWVKEWIVEMKAKIKKMQKG